MEHIYRTYCIIHKLTKMILGRFVSANDVAKEKSIHLKLGVIPETAREKWLTFISNAKVKEPSDFQNMYNAGYIRETGTWCLPSWIWTNSAMVRMFANNNKIEDARNIADRLLSFQKDCGGWIVRYDYDKDGAIPILAPNDSAYIASNAMLSIFEKTQDNRYIQAAVRCADWIIKTARPDGMVYVGYDMKRQKWDKSCVIVDVGFTASLFAHLYELTKEEKYINYLKIFTNRYIELFYVPSKKAFCTNIDAKNRQNSGLFGRGQAWALEGLIPAYRVLKDDSIKQVIEGTIETILSKQHKNGGWAYNLAKPLMGEDCKGIPVIAKVLMDWYAISIDERIKKSAQKALKWCINHTSASGDTEGGIFSFCLEGAVVHNLYSTCAFVYASAYAIELDQIMKQCE